MEVQMEQMANQIEEEELQRQLEANLDGHYVVDEGTSYHEQAITTMKNGEVVETHGEERKEEQIEAPQALHRAKGEEVSTETPSSSTLILEMPYEPRASIAYDLPRGQKSSLLGLLEEQKETIKKNLP
jgi:septum formation inhibitor MinC